MEKPGFFKKTWFGGANKSVIQIRLL